MDQRAAAACSNLLSLPESVDFKWIRLSWQPCLATIDGLHLKPKRPGRHGAQTETRKST